jgi:hypothetical protein
MSKKTAHDPIRSRRIRRGLGRWICGTGDTQKDQKQLFRAQNEMRRPWISRRISEDVNIQQTSDGF